jgi:hypothetical protein
LLRQAGMKTGSNSRNHGIEIPALQSAKICISIETNTNKTVGVLTSD